MKIKSIAAICKKNKQVVLFNRYSDSGTISQYIGDGKHYRRVFGENGIRTIYGMTGAESIPIIKAAMEKLSDDISEDYWEATEGNAKKALAGLLAFAQMRPDGVWKGD